MTGYTRVDTINNIADGNIINADDLDGEFDGVQAAFNSSTGHSHDGTAGEGAPILALGPVQDVTVSATVLGVKTNNAVDIGTTSLRFKDFYLAGAASISGTLAVGGNTTLGDASTDTVTVNGYMGVGGAPASTVGVYIQNTALTGTTPQGVLSAPVGGSSATGLIASFASAPQTAVASFTVDNVIGFRAAAVTKGAGSTITNQHGVYIADQIQGTNNFGITSLVSSGTNKWNIYASGTAANAFAGSVRVGGVTAPVATLDVTGNIRVAHNNSIEWGGTAYSIVGNATTGFLQFNTASTERMRIDSSGNVGIGTTTPATMLDVVGSVTLGDASTDTVTVNGYMGVGGAGSVSAKIVLAATQTTTGSVQYGINGAPVFGSDATSVGAVYSAQPRTSAASYTINQAIGYRAIDVVQGAGSTITSQYGVYIEDQTKGTNNFGITSLVSSGTNKWNIYASGTAANYFAGNVGIGTSSPAFTLDVSGRVAASTDYLLRDTGGTARSVLTIDSNDDLLLQTGTTTGTRSVVLKTEGAERMRIDSSGNLLIGTTSAASTQGAPLQVITAIAARRNIATTGGPAFRFEKSRATTDGTYTIVANGDTLGEQQFYGADGVQYIIGASVKAVVDGTPGTNDMPTALVLSTTADGASSVTERMRIDSSGNVGIGTSSPTNTLSVTGTANVTGNVTLGDASTDTVTVNGYMGVGGAGSSGRALQIVNTSLVGTAQEGIRSQITGTSAATGDIRSYISVPGTASASFTVTEVVGYFAANATLGAGSAITNQHGLYIADQTRGTNNYGVTSLVSSGSNKWNIYASGTAANYFAGNVGVGVAPSVAKFDLSFSDAATYSSSNMATGLAGYVVNSSATDSTSATLLFACNGTSTDAQGAISLVHTGTGLGALAFGTRAAGNVIERMRIDSSGNMGLGVTPSAWGTGYKAIDIAARTSLATGGSNEPLLVYNGYYNGTNWIYKATTSASYYQQIVGEHRWFNAASGTAGNAITFTQAMTLDASGYLGIGTTSVGSPLTVVGPAGYVVTIDGATDTRMDFKNSGTRNGLIQSTSSAFNVNAVTSIPLVFLTGSAERARIDTVGNLQMQTGAVMPYAPAPASISTTATLTNANIQAQIINTTGTSYTVTMPLGTTLETLATWATTNVSYDFYVINTASGTITMAVNTGVTSLGGLTIATGTSAQFRIRRTAANTFVLYRLG